MIRRGVKLQLLVFALVTLLGTTYVGASYAGLADRLVNKRYTVLADFADSGGIFTNAEVTYRGVAVGRVGPLRLSGDGVLVALEIARGTRVPADTRAVVANRSAVGEQYVDLQPAVDHGPYLRDGSRIPRDRTATPLPVTTLMLNLDRLVNSVDRTDLGVVIDELGAAFQGTGPALQRLVDSGDALTRAATEALPPTVRLIQDGKTVLDTQRDTAGAIRSFSADLASLSDQLRASDPDLRGILANGPGAAAQVQGLLQDNQGALPILLANLVTLGQIQAVRLPGLEQILVTYPTVVSGGYTVVRKGPDGKYTAHFGLSTQSSPTVCDGAGYAGTRERTPSDYNRDPAADAANPKANTGARCAEPRGSATSVRGAQNVPAPGSGGARATPGAAMAGYDPVTGQTTAPDGTPLVIGSYGGQYRLLGESSWTWLFVGPLAA